MKPRINLCCALRQGSTYANCFFNQIKSLTGNGYVLGAVTIAVDGEQLTDPVLIEAQRDLHIQYVFEGPRSAPSCHMHERSIAWARTVNMALSKSLTSPSEFTLWIESDLSFPCDLIELLMEPLADIVAPIIMLGENFYDSWGFRDLKGNRISSLARMQALPRARELIELSSVGSCLLIRSSIIAHGVRLPPGYDDGLLVGFCREARVHGARVYCRRDVAVIHPTSLWKEQISRITCCRAGNARDWRELAPSGGGIVAGPYFDFVLPAAVKLVARAKGGTASLTHICFASNPQREIAILLGDGKSMPFPPESFGQVSPTISLPPPSLLGSLYSAFSGLFRLATHNKQGQERLISFKSYLEKCRRGFRGG